MNTSGQEVYINPIYENNLAALRERYPQIAQRLEDCSVNIEYEMRGSGVKNNVNVFSLKINSFYYDEENPLKDVESQLKKLQLKNAKIAVFLGFGLGYEVDYYGKHMAGECSTIQMLIIEKDVELFKIALHMFNYVPMINSENIHLVVGERQEDLFPAFEKLLRNGAAVVYLKAMKPIYHISSLKINKDYYMNALKILNECGTFVLKFYGNSIEDSLIGLENILSNVEEIIVNPGINMLYDKFHGKPAIVVSTGPSLNKNKHLLKGLQDKALIVAADASLKILMDMGVKPHLVTSLERFPLVIEMVEGYNKEQVEDVYLAGCPVIDHGVYEAYAGPTIIVYRNFDHFRWLGIERGILDIKQSSGNMAFKVAAALGCSPIILIGQDLAYSRDGKTHAKGNVFGEAQKDLVDDYHGARYEVMGNDGLPILTNEDWDSFRKAYEVDVAEYTGQCINSTEGGAYINGTKVMTLQEAINKYIKEQFDPSFHIREAISKFTDTDARNDLEKVRELIVRTKRDLVEMRKECLEGYRKLEENEKDLSKYLNKDTLTFSKIEEEILIDLKNEITGYKTRVLSIQPTMQKFLMHILQPFYIKFEMDLHEIPDKYDNKCKLNAHVVLAHMKWFMVVHDLLNLCIESLTKAEEKAKSINL